jgi:hypothetical protein
MTAFLSHDFGRDPSKVAPNCLFCMTPRIYASGECSVRLRGVLSQTEEQLALLKSDLSRSEMAREAAGGCTCIQTHALTCPAGRAP